MHRRAYCVVNGISIYRIAAAFLLLILIIIRRPDIFKWLLAISFFTDAIDGFLARKYKVTSTFGARIDSIGDDLTILMAVIGLIVMKTAFLKQQQTLIIIILTLYVAQNVLAFIRYNKMTSFHTYLAKAAALLQGCFLILLFFLPQPPLNFFYASAGVTILDIIEEIIMVLLLRHWQSDIKGLYRAIKLRRHAKK